MTNDTTGAAASTSDGKTKAQFVPLWQMIEDAKPDTKVLDWFHKWKDYPGSAKALIAIQMRIKRHEVEAFIQAMDKGIDSMKRYLNERLPDITSLGEILDADIGVEPEVIEGVLRRGCKAVLGGPSKSHKTWALLNLAASIASGRQWIGFGTVKGRVLYVNLELQDYNLKTRIQDIIKARGLKE